MDSYELIHKHKLIGDLTHELIQQAIKNHMFGLITDAEFIASVKEICRNGKIGKMINE